MENLNVNTDMQFNEEAVRQQIESEVMTELDLAGIKVIPDHFVFEDALKDIVLRYDKATADMEAYKEDVYSKYLPHVAETMFKCEKESYENSRLGFIEDVDKIAEMDKEYKLHKIEEGLRSEEYQAIKADVFRDLSYLKGCKVPYQLAGEITAELVAHCDIKALKIAECMLGANKTEAGRLIGNNIGQLTHQLELLNEDSPLIKEVKKYFYGGEESFMVYQLKHK